MFVIDFPMEMLYAIKRTHDPSKAEENTWGGMYPILKRISPPENTGKLPASPPNKEIIKWHDQLHDQIEGTNTKLLTHKRGQKKT